MVAEIYFSISGTIFLYVQTGTVKTFTMVGGRES